MPQCTKSAPDHNIDAEFLDSAQDAALPYPLVTGSLQWSLLREAIEYSLASIAGEDGKVAINFPEPVLEPFVYATGHQRIIHLWESQGRTRAAWLSGTETRAAFDDVFHAQRTLFSTGSLEWILDTGILMVRVTNWAEALTYPFSFVHGYDQGQVDQAGIDKQQRLSDLRLMQYGEYLQSPEWQIRRERHLDFAGWRCQVCNAENEGLHVHHRTYANRGHERSSDLIVLCSKCHELFHTHRKVVR